MWILECFFVFVNAFVETLKFFQTFLTGFEAVPNATGPGFFICPWFHPLTVIMICAFSLPVPAPSGV